MVTAGLQAQSHRNVGVIWQSTPGVGLLRNLQGLRTLQCK